MTHTADQQAAESARALLWRHGVPEDVLDGALALHAQELAERQRADAQARYDRSYSDNRVFELKGARAAADLIEPGALPPAVFAAPVSPLVDRAAAYRLAADAVEGMPGYPRLVLPEEIVAELRRLAAEQPTTCPGYETVPNLCRCGCEGCKHNCAAHQPAAEEQPAETQALCGRLASIPSPCSAGDWCCARPVVVEQPDTQTREADTLPTAHGVCSFGENEATAAGCIKRAGHDGEHVVTGGVARPECAHCWREIENRGAPSMDGNHHVHWVHVPGGFTPCFPQRGGDSPRAEPRATE